MMISTQTLVDLADQFCIASGGMRETTLSHRMFGDSKKLSALRGASDITVGRFNAAMCWMAENWPEGHERPISLAAYISKPPGAKGGEPDPSSQEDAA